MRVAFCLALLPLLLMQLAAARFYKPRPLVCPVTKELKVLNELLEATQVEVVTTPFVVNKVQVNTLYQSRPVAVTHVAIETVTAAQRQVELTEVQLVFETVPFTVVKVNTATLTLTSTVVDPYTLTATNYVTQVETVAAPETVHDTVTVLETKSVTVTQRVMAMATSTLTHTRAVLQTKLVEEVVQETSGAVTTTLLQVDTFTYTHILTKMITQTICPPPSQRY